MKLRLLKEHPEPEPFNLVVSLFWSDDNMVSVFVGDNLVLGIRLSGYHDKVILMPKDADDLPAYIEYGSDVE